MITQSLREDEDFQPISEDQYHCADCGLKTNYAGLCAGILKRDPDEQPEWADLLCEDCIAERRRSDA
jgi:hypothetical protein